MVAHQLDLFGGPLKPPKKIKVDDYDLEADEPKPVEEPINIPVEEATDVVKNDVAEEADAGNNIIATNDIEWAPEVTNEDDTSLAREFSGEDLADEIHEAASHEADCSIEPNPEEPFSNDEAAEATNSTPAKQDAEEPAFTNEAIFTPQIITTEETKYEAAEAAVVADDLPCHDTEGLPPADLQLEDVAEVLQETNGTSIETVTTESFAEEVPGRRGKNDHEENNDGLNVPPDEELFKRQYYTMRETSAMFGVNQSLLRFWENEFDILQPKKNKKGDRYFRPADIKNLVMIYHLLRVRKFTMDGAKDYLQSHKKAGDTFELIKRLEKIKSFLFELKAGL